MNKPEGGSVTRIARAFPDRVEVRGRDLTGDLMGRLTFTEYFHLLLTGAVAAEYGKPLTMNVAMPIAAVLLDLGFDPAVVKAVPILARTAGLLAHLAEEREQPLGFLMAAAAEEAVDYE